MSFNKLCRKWIKTNISLYLRYSHFSFIDICIRNILEQYPAGDLCRFGIGENIRYYNVNELCLLLTNDICRALPFFHAFTDCDTTSSFYNHSKFKIFDAWMKYSQKEDVTNVFKELYNEPLSVTENQLDILEKFIPFVHYPK